MEIWIESAKSNTSQRLTDQTMLILKKNCFFGLEILEICGQVNQEEFTQIESTKRVEMLNTDNQTTTEPSTTTSILVQEDKTNVELIKKVISEHKTTLPSLRNQDWKKVQVETEKVNKLLKYIPTDNITELNELIYAGAKLVSDKIETPQRNSNRNAKLGWEMRIEVQIKKLQQKAKHRNPTK